MIRLSNTLTRHLDTFSPQQPDHVRLYTCGPTVYDRLHVGNWFSYIMWDTLVRVLHANGYTVERVMNITDVGHLTSDEDHGEDKLQKGAQREGKTAWEIAKHYTNDFLHGMEQLNLITPEHLAKATDFIPQQLDLVRALKQKSYTYQTSDGIYFDTSKFPRYASFAQLDLAAQKAGARVEHNPEKRNPSDFALWKFTPANTRRDMEWETPPDLLETSPAQNESHSTAKSLEVAPRMGFPGWHLECSAIAMHFFGPTLDIHTGGIDHIPVHHTNEIAQSEAATGQPFAHFWLHNNHLKSNNTKISKSLGNGYTLDDLAQRGFSPMNFRMFALQSRYSNESNFTWDNLEAAKNRLHHWRNIAALRWQTHDTIQSKAAEAQKEGTVMLGASKQAILDALNNDLNTPDALRIIDEAFAKLDVQKPGHLHEYGLNELLQTIDELLGLQLQASTPDISDEAKQLILQRQRAREAKDWVAADAARDQLAMQGIEVRDGVYGSIWEYK